MIVVILPLVLAAFFLAMRVAVFEAVFFTILVTPILAFLVGQLTGDLTSVVFYGTMLLVAICTAKLSLKSDTNSWSSRQQLYPILIFCAAYTFFFSLNQLWPDFMPMGERLRDYALVSAVMQYPLEAREPWMSGAALNYYLYWYRFGQMLGALFGLDPWEVYHRLQAFVCGLYVTCGFVILWRWLAWRASYAFVGAVIIALGSNVAGVRDFLSGDTNWWGPSRVVKGAINEFPAWSFLLGDVHPHFLNLPLMPFMVLVGLAVWSASRSAPERLVLAVCGGLIGFQWISYSNAWEIPAYLTVLGVLLVLGALRTQREDVRKAWIALKPLRSYITINNTAIVALTVCMSLSLYLSTRNIDAGGLSSRWVTSTIGRTPVSELLLHWGIPLTLILVTLIGMLPTWRSRSAAIGLVTLALVTGASWVLLAVIALLTIDRLYRELLDEPCSADLVINLSLLVGGVLIISPEIFFFDDAYGSDIERMNTIFKFYSAAWFFLHIAAFGLMWQWLSSAFADQDFAAIPQIVPALAVCAILIFSTGFFWQTAKVRRSPPCTILPCDRGLSMLDSEKPGAAFSISHLSQMAPGTVLEAQGAPYSLTSHVSTLSGKESYLGWSNHITLLTRKYDEAKRREEVTKKIYSSTDCELIRATLHSERITYLVFGPLERQAYPTANETNFKCLQQVVQQGGYWVFVG